jgi:hypothetical protein
MNCYTKAAVMLSHNSFCRESGGLKANCLRIGRRFKISLHRPLGLPVLPLVSYAYMPSPLPRQVQWSLFARLSPLPAAFPV